MTYAGHNKEGFRQHVKNKYFWNVNTVLQTKIHDFGKMARLQRLPDECLIGSEPVWELGEHLLVLKVSQI
jgi:hypothetical protein